MSGANSIGIEIVTLAKRNGVLSKHISLDPDGKLISDGSECVMGSGAAWRTAIEDMTAFAGHIGTLGPSEAIALGRLRHGVPDRVTITTKARLNGITASDVIARTGEFIDYLPGAPAMLLIDVDHKGMPDSVRARVKAQLGVLSAIASVVPELGTCGCVVRNSTTTGLSRQDTGEVLPGSEGRHLYILVQDGADIERALRALHDRLWLAGLGWMLVGAAGQLLERSLADRMVYAPERLVFEAPPVIDPPLVQDVAGRRPVAREGAPLDTAVAIPDLTPTERVTLDRLKAAERARLKPDCAKARAAWIDTRTEELVQRGIMPAEARLQAERAVDGGALLPDFVLLFDQMEFLGSTVGNVLADPERFLGATLADPLEGIEYGRAKAQIMRRDDGSMWIHSFAHGRTTYELKHDAARLRSLLASASDEEVIERYARLVRRTDLGDLTRTDIENELANRLKARFGGTGVRGFARHLKMAKERIAGEINKRRKEAQERARIEAGDVRPQIERPADDAPYLPVTAQLDAVLSATGAVEPPMRNLEGYLTMALSRRPLGMHLLTSAGADNDEPEEARLPPPETVLLTQLTDIEAAQLIETYIDYIHTTEDGVRSVRLPAVFIKSYHQQRTGSPLPTVTAVAAMPIILPDGTMLSGHHLDHERGILFRVPDGLEQVLPRPEDCDADAVAEAMHCLCDEWLCDVPTSYAGKVKLLTTAASIIERAILPERPAYVVSAGQRGSGKTTAINMISAAVLGQRVSAAAWSIMEEERRKALFALFADGVALICWDNIRRGDTITDPNLEKSLTSPTLNDRILGVSEYREVPTTSILVFTGNNISPKGETAARTLVIILFATRADPENRPVKHIDPIEWTFANRSKILRAIYTIILGNPRRRGIPNSPPETRFKLWQDLIGSAFEHGATCHRDRFADKDDNCPPEAVSFKDEFTSNDTEDEEGGGRAIVLRLLHERWPGGTTTTGILAFSAFADSYVQYGDPAAQQRRDDAVAFNDEFYDALEASSHQTPPKKYTTRILTARLKAIANAPTQDGDRTLMLTFEPHHLGGSFKVKIV